MEIVQSDVEAVMKERSVGRHPLHVVRRSHASLALDATLTAMLDAIPDYVLVLNDKRQIVAVNRPMREVLGMQSVDELLGMRPGEAFGCLYHDEGKEGCGTGHHCTICGAVHSMVTAMQNGKQDNSECRLITASGVSLDLQVTTTPLVIKGHSYLVSAFRDISATKRRDVFERLFFHDILNTAGGIHGLASLLAEDGNLPREKEEEFKAWMKSLSNQLVEEIWQQRKLVLAEKGEFIPDYRSFSIAKCLEDVQVLYANHQVAEGKTLRIDYSADISIVSDESVLRRILGNLVKNALEAIPPRAMVILSCDEEPDQVVFKIHNPGVIPDEVKLQIFRRSFSTKSAVGRGIGTYSVKLFAESYLKGSVGFVSDEARGTVFSLVLPKKVE